MSISIYNSLTKKKEELTPIKDKVINIYTCGVTVYDRCHIGHARSLYVFDVVRRYLKYRGFKVNFVRNITDIDDKIINKANELKKDWKAVVDENIKAYYADLKMLALDKADKEPRATENIESIIKDIEGLIERGFAYEMNGDVYYKVRKFKHYGKLSGQSIEKMLEGVRIDLSEKKKDPLDFALWKKSKDGEPSWDSPWGAGRPGWHIECSCMSLKHLKCETLDIHAGGRDLIFPHHENEIAQAEGLTGKPFSKYWLHHGLLTINGQKMSKSLGNFITVEDALKKYTVDTLKLFFLFSHYASPIDYSDEKLQEAYKGLQRFDVLFWKAYGLLKGKKSSPAKGVDFIEEHKEKFLSAMDDDFNTALALGHLFDLVNATNKFIDKEKESKDYLKVIYAAVETIEDLAKNIFGLFLREKDKDLDQEDEKLLEDRKTARLKKDFKRSDELRDLLKSRGIAVEDTKDGQSWRWI
ncbi:MAG: cysteine--tRNA ligase [Omnitrophica WOR_2 bacterium GWA2_47_8]|nr:MAG: cysteine--tRNA ligase [Omnitrophica WOR_2 bacterium GWA2_47_8]